MIVRLERLRWILLVLLFLSTAINYIDRQALSVLLPTLRQELALTGSAYGLITTVFLIAYTVSQLVSGLLMDGIGARRGLALSVIIWSAAAMSHAWARGAVSLGLLRLALGLGEAGNWPAGGKTIAQWFPPHRRAFAMGLFDGGSAVGAILAPPLVAFLALQYSWRAAFIVTGALGFTWVVAWWFVCDTPERHRWLSAEDRKTVLEETQRLTPRSTTSFGASVRSLLGIRQLWGLMATRMLATPVWWFYVFWLPDYLANDREFTLVEIGFFGWIPYLAVDLGKLLGGGISDRMLRHGASATRARKSVMVCGAIAMAASTLVVSAESAAAAVAWVCVATFGFGMWSANILALHADLFPTEKIGSALGLTGMAASAGGAISTYLIGRIVDASGYESVFLVAGIATLLACFALFFWIGRVVPCQPTKPEEKKNGAH